METLNNNVEKCFHCSQPVYLNSPAIIQGESLPCCCTSCRAIVETVDRLGLWDFYKLRDVDPSNAIYPEGFQLQEVVEETAGISTGFEKFNDPAFYEIQGDSSATAWLFVENIHCAACVWLIENALKRIEGIDDIGINLSSKELLVQWDINNVSLELIVQSINRLGYVARPIKFNEREMQNETRKRQFIKQLALSGFGAAQVMMFSLALYVGEFHGDELGLQKVILWSCALITTPVIFFSGRTFFVSAWSALRNSSLNMDVPVSIALTLAYLQSLVNTFGNQQPVYYDTICMLIFFLGLSRYLEFFTASKSYKSFRLSQVQLAEKYILLDKRGEHQVDVEQICVGDIILVRAGEFLPVDGEVVEGNSEVNESILTGEFEAVPKSAGCRVYAGTNNGEGVLKVKVTAVKEASRLGRIESLARQAQLEAPETVKLGERVSRVFVSVVLLATTLNAVYWFFIDSGRMLPTSLAMLIVSCPCALALAIPLANNAAKQRLMRLGLIPMKADVFENLEAVTDVVLDKTGTLTRGRYDLLSCEILDKKYSEVEVLSLAACLEQYSQHPVAGAFTRYKKHHELEGYPEKYNIEGEGEALHGKVSGLKFAIGEKMVLADIFSLDSGSAGSSQQGVKSVYMANEHGWIVRFELQDLFRPNLSQLFSFLESKKILVHILSGDEKHQVLKLADWVQKDQLHWRMSPEDKLAYVNQLKEKGRKVMTVGDGLNDAPLVAAGDFSVAIGSGANITKENADILMLSNDLMVFKSLFDSAGKLKRKVRQNLFWAFSYNLLVLPLASVGWIPPYLAAAGMSLSSLVVVLNSFWWKREKMRTDPDLADGSKREYVATSTTS